MRVPQGVVLTACAVVASPLLGLLHQGHIDVEGAALRLVLCLAACWVALEVVAALMLPPVDRTVRSPVPPAGPDPAAEVHS